MRKRRERKTYVKILQNTAKNLRFFIRKINPLTLLLRTKLATTSRRKERTRNQHILMRRKQSSFPPHCEGYDRGGEVPTTRAMAHGGSPLDERLLQFRQLRGISIRFLQ